MQNEVKILGCCAHGAGNMTSGGTGPAVQENSNTAAGTATVFS
jgi:hypothetical protein